MSVGTGLNLTLYPASDATALSDLDVNAAADGAMLEGCGDDEALASEAASACEYVDAAEAGRCSGRGDGTIEGIYPWAFGGTRFMSATGVPISPSVAAGRAAPSASSAATTAIVHIPRNDGIVVRSSQMSSIVYKDARHSNLDALTDSEAARLSRAVIIPPAVTLSAYSMLTALCYIYGSWGGALVLIFSAILVLPLLALYTATSHDKIRFYLKALTGRFSQSEVYQWHTALRNAADAYVYGIEDKSVDTRARFIEALDDGSQVLNEEDGRVYDFRKLMGPQMLDPFAQLAARSPIGVELLRVIAEHNELADSEEFIAPIAVNWHSRAIDAEGIEEAVKWFAERGNSSVMEWLLTLVEAKNAKAQKILEGLQKSMDKDAIASLIQGQRRFRVVPQEKKRVGGPYRVAEDAEEPVMVQRVTEDGKAAV